MMEDEQVLPGDSFGQMGRTYQEKVVQCLVVDPQFAEQIGDVILPQYFDLRYLEEITRLIFRHKQEFRTFPSLELIEIMVSKEVGDDILSAKCREFLARIRETPVGGDMAYIEKTALDFARRQSLKAAMVAAIDRIEQNDYEAISGLVKDALNKGVARDMGHEYTGGLTVRTKSSARKPISTGWSPLDVVFAGGWERGILATFIAPTGAGKSMFLVNCAAAIVAQGLNALYVTCEMADYKIGLRADSYYSGVAINDIPNRQEEVQKEITEKAKGRMIIKEFPTKTASVQTIRAYVQRLAATKNFVPDMIVVDYADLLRSSRGFEQKRFELESVYEELRAMAQELNAIVVTADQTNRAGLDMEIVTIGQIGEAYAKATVCDVIMTISRRMEDKQQNTGRLFVAKSRLGNDGMVFPFLLNTSTVKVSLLPTGSDPLKTFLESNKNLAKKTSDRAEELGFVKKPTSSN